MKFFSRKALVAGATAIAVSFAGVNVASAAEANAPAGLSSWINPGSSSDTNQPNEAGETPGGNDDETTDKGSSANPKDIKEWIGIITAVVGALSAIYTFINKISK